MKLWPGRTAVASPERPRFPGIRAAMDGSAAIVAMETAGSEAAGAYPITPSTQMGEGWAAAVADGKRNVNGRRLLFFEPEGEHAAAAVTAGMSMVGLRATNFSSGQGIAYMHESLYAAVGKRLTYVLNVACRAMTKHSLNVHAGHDDYHAIDDTGFFQLFAKDVQQSADFNLIAHRVAELSLNPGICAQDGFLTSHVIESLYLPERDLVREFLGDPADMIDAPTAAQRLVFGAKRRRIPEMFDLDYPAMLGVVQNQESYAQGVAAQRPFYFDHIADLSDQAFAEFAHLTGRSYTRAEGYRLDDAEYAIVGQGSVVSNAEAVCDHLRDVRGLRVGVMNLAMFRPFPADLVSRMLRGKKGVVVLERTDQPLAVDAPLLRELRAAMAQAMENGRVRTAEELPFRKLAALEPAEVPDFYSGCFGLGSRDLQPSDIIAAVENMLPGGAHRRQFYLGIDFIRPGTKLPKLQIWQEKLEAEYPDLEELSLKSAEEVNLLPAGSVSLRIHSVGGWGAITMGKNVASTVFELFGLHIKANPKYGSEKKGQPTTFYATFAPEPIRLNCELRNVDVVLSPDPNVFLHSNPLAGLVKGGAFVIQTDRPPEQFWDRVPVWARQEMHERGVKVYLLDGFKIASGEASDTELRYRMQGAAFMGAFFAVSPLVKEAGLDEAKLFAGIRRQLEKKFARLGASVVEDNIRVMDRGFHEMRALDYSSLPMQGGVEAAIPEMPSLLDVPAARDGFGNPGRFWEQVCFPTRAGQDGIADPFAALSAIPAATGAVRDMTDVRMEVPLFHPDKCTGCSQCWVQCPDSAIPGLVTEIDQLIDVAMGVAANGKSLDRMRQVSKHLVKETRRLLTTNGMGKFTDVFSAAFDNVVPKLGWDDARRAELAGEFSRVKDVLADFPVAKTAPFFDNPESKQPGTGALLSITVNPEACKGCNLCVAVCPDGALESVRQDAAIVETLRNNWKIWEKLPDTPERFAHVTNIDEGVGILSSLLLSKDAYRSMVGGDGACMGCGEKTAVHLIISAIHSLMLPRVAAYLARLDDMISQLDTKARAILASDADLERASSTSASEIAVPLAPAKRAELERITQTIHALRDLRWRYTEGPGGKGRAQLGMANSTGCSSVWGSTYPYNPYPFPWVNHLFQDSPSIAIGLFEGQMRKMSDQFVEVRRAELLLADNYDVARDEDELAKLDWKSFSDEEFGMCPPIVAMGGDGAMLDIGFQNLSRLLASGKPIRVIVLDTQVYSNTGGQACTSGYTGQVSDMAAYGEAQHGKTEVRKEMALMAIAHRGVFVHQSSQASASHLISGVLRGLNKRRPAIFNIYTPCPVEHGLADDWSTRAARLALESRAFPFLTYDPDAGPLVSDALTLDGNPALDELWPMYALEYVDGEGGNQRMDLPLTIADWAATEGRFKRHFHAVPADKWNDDMIPFHSFLELSLSDREGKTPFIYTLAADKRLNRLEVSREIVMLAEERLQFWGQLRELAGLEPSATVRDRLVSQVQAEYEQRLEQLRADYEGKMAELRATYPVAIARRMAEALLKGPKAASGMEDLLSRVTVAPVAERPVPVAAAKPVEAVAVAASTATATAVPPEAEVGLSMDPYIESERCTTCNECTNLNGKMFVYNAEKQAIIRDPRAGTFQQLVVAAERCPVGIIHPGTPLNPKEKDLEKWIKRAAPFS
ncbi:MAG: 2-oxoacid:acceptor oxidoreductase family protein [Gemmatimonadaceae bacterium]|nr:2-oxoacid:acceptor oxidoreductase family protein [Gemmatimonadaceae bacterium]